MNTVVRETVEQLRQRLREAAEFKPGELTEEEEALVQREGLTALDYIPKRIIQQQAEAFQKWEAAGRPKTTRSLHDKWRDRNDGYGYGMYLLIIAGFSGVIIGAYDWLIGIFVCILMLAVLELGYQVPARR